MQVRELSSTLNNVKLKNLWDCNDIAKDSFSKQNFKGITEPGELGMEATAQFKYITESRQTHHWPYI